MKLISVNIGQERSIPNAKASGKTGIYKIPIRAPVQITANGIPDDAICDTKHHGGPDQAIYIYGTPDYQAWSQALGRELEPGTFGENLTISELESAALRVGDILQINEVLLQVTSPRMPCVTLAARMSDKKFPEKFRQMERPGLYCRVLNEGWIQEGEVVSLERYSGETISILGMFRDYYIHDLDVARVQQHLDVPIAIRDRLEKEKQLQQLLGK